MGSISPDTLARLAASREQQPPTANTAGGGAHYDADAFREANDDDLAAMGIHARPAKPGSKVEELDGCPYDNDHEAFRVV